MKAMVVEEYNKPLVYREDFPDPVLWAENDVLIRVTACGLCATDLKVQHGYLETPALPIIPGHEVAGVVVEVGSSVKNVKVGDRVISSTYMRCCSCDYCRRGRDTLCDNLEGRLGITVNGGFAEYMRAKAHCLVKLPDNVDDAQACIIPCGAGVPYHTFMRIAQVGSSDQIIILGAGGIGLQAIEMCKLCGAKVIALDIDEEKLNLARQHGADFTVNTKKPGFEAELTSFGLSTMLFDSSGVPEMITRCAAALKKGARIITITYGPGKDLVLPLTDVVLKEFEIYGSRGVGIQDVSDMVDLLAEGKFSPEVRRYPLSKLNEVMEALAENRLIGRAVMIPDALYREEKE